MRWGKEVRDPQTPWAFAGLGYGGGVSGYLGGFRVLKDFKDFKDFKVLNYWGLEVEGGFGCRSLLGGLLLLLSVKFGHILRGEGTQDLTEELAADARGVEDF